MTQLREHLQGRGKVQTLSRARIQPMGNGVQPTISRMSWRARSFFSPIRFGPASPVTSCVRRMPSTASTVDSAQPNPGGVVVLSG